MAYRQSFYGTQPVQVVQVAQAAAAAAAAAVADRDKSRRRNVSSETDTAAADGFSVGRRKASVKGAVRVGVRESAPWLRRFEHV